MSFEPVPDRRLLPDEALATVTAAARLVDPSGRAGAILDALVPIAVRHPQLMDIVDASLDGHPGALDDLEQLALAHGAPVEGRVHAARPRPDETVAAPHSPSPVLDEARLVRFAAALGRVAARRGEDISFDDVVEGVLDDVARYAAVGSMLVSDAIGAIPIALPMILGIGGFDPGMHDGDLGPPGWLPGRERIPERFRVGINDPVRFLPVHESHKLDCALFAYQEAKQLPTYHVTGIDPAGACAGTIVQIDGSGFGSQPGQVVFTALGGVALSGPPAEWQPNRIRVTVPEGATCGPIHLQVVQAVTVCGVQLALNPVGTGAIWFSGGEATAKSFSVNGSTGASVFITPGTPVVVAWDACGATTVSVTDDAANQLATSSASSGMLTVPTATVGRTHVLAATIAVTNHCTATPFERTIVVHVHRSPQPTIDGIEVTQAIQRYRSAEHLAAPAGNGADNALALVSGKMAHVHAYVRSGQDPDWNGGEVADVTGSATIERRIAGAWTVVASMQADNAPVMARASHPSHAAERGADDRSLRFVIPAAVMSGELRITVSASAPTPFGTVHSPARSVEVSAPVRQTVRVRMVRIAVPAPGNLLGGTMLPTPTVADAVVEFDLMLRMLPISDIEFVDLGVAQPATWGPAGRPFPAGGCDPNWGPVNQVVIAAANGFVPGWFSCGFIPAGHDLAQGGSANSGAAGFALAGTTENQVIAHEFIHAAGLAHSPCGDVGAVSNYPPYAPYDSGGGNPDANGVYSDASIGEFGFDIATAAIHDPSVRKDIMSYCGSTQWIGMWTHQFLTNANPLMNAVPVAPAGAGAGVGAGVVTPPVRSSEGPSSGLLVTGAVAADGTIDDVTVLRRDVHRTPVGARTDLRVEVRQDDDVVASPPVWALVDHQPAGVELDADVVAPFRFIAFAPCPPGATTLRILDAAGTARFELRRGTGLAVHDVAAQVTGSDEDRFVVVTWNVRGDVGDDAVTTVWSSNGDEWDVVGVLFGGGHRSLRCPARQITASTTQFSVVVDRELVSEGEMSDVTALPDSAGEVVVLAPAAGAVVTAGQAAGRGRAIVVGGNLGRPEPDDYRWEVDGVEAGNGSEVWLPAMAAGEHRVTVHVGDHGSVERTVRAEVETRDD